MNILAIGAHPDDIEMQCAGTLALYARDHRPRIAQRLVLSPPLYSQNATRTVNGVEQDYVQPTWRLFGRRSPACSNRWRR